MYKKKNTYKSLHVPTWLLICSFYLVMEQCAFYNSVKSAEHVSFCNFAYVNNIFQVHHEFITICNILWLWIQFSPNPKPFRSISFWNWHLTLKIKKNNPIEINGIFSLVPFIATGNSVDRVSILSFSLKNKIISRCCWILDFTLISLFVFTFDISKKKPSSRKKGFLFQIESINQTHECLTFKWGILCTKSVKSNKIRPFLLL